MQTSVGFPHQNNTWKCASPEVELTGNSHQNPRILDPVKQDNDSETPYMTNFPGLHRIFTWVKIQWEDFIWLLFASPTEDFLSDLGTLKHILKGFLNSFKKHS